MTFANDRQSSLPAAQNLGNFWVTHGGPIELPRKNHSLCPEIVEKAAVKRAIALPDLNSISGVEFELCSGFATTSLVEKDCGEGFSPTSRFFYSAAGIWS